MKIREKKQHTLKLVEESIRTSKKGIQFVENSLNPLEEVEEDEAKEIDPTRFLSRQEKKEWNRLSEHKQAQFIKRGIKTGGKISDHHNTINESRNRNQFEEIDEQATIENMYTSKRGQHTMLNEKKDRHFPINKSKENSKKGKNRIFAKSKEYFLATSNGATATLNIAEKIATASAAGQMWMVTKVGKKTAEMFQETLAAKAMVAQQAQERLQETKVYGAMPKPVEHVVTTFTSVMASFAAIVIQLVSTFFSALLSVIALVIPVIIVICTVVVIITSILVALTSSNTAGYNLPTFVTEEMMEAFFEAQEKEGIPVSSGIAQLIAESGFGLYGPGGESGEGLSQLAYDYKNLFGIKYFRSDQYAIGAVDMQTGEEVNGGNVEIIAGFSVYPNYTACIRQRTWMLLREPYASNVSAYLNQNNGEYTKEDAKNFIGGIKAAGWATSSAYVERCIEHMDQYNLYQFDNMTFEDYKSGIGGGSYDGTVTPIMQNIVRVAETNTGSYPCTPDMCAAWVTGVYQVAGAPVTPYGDAIDMWNTYKSTGSTSMENIPPGAIVCGSGSGYMGSLYGHVGIYIGNGMVAHNAGYHSIQTLEEWSAWQTAVCQGHQGWIGWVYPGGVPTE